MSRPTRLKSTSHAGTETDIADIPSRTREEPEGLYKMMITITNELKNINKRYDKDREELLTRIKKQEERKGPSATSLRGDIQLLAQQIRMQAARKGRGINQIRLLTSPPSNLSTQHSQPPCSARDNKSPRYSR